MNETYQYSPQDWEEKIVRLYKDHRGMTKYTCPGIIHVSTLFPSDPVAPSFTRREQATMEYLRIAQDLDMFGITYFKIKNKKSSTQYLGVGALGLTIYDKQNKCLL